MKKLIGFILAHICFEIGHAICRLSYWKKKGKYVFDQRQYLRIGIFLANQYQKWMHYSYRIQKWSGNNKPWKSKK